ncbi:MAG: O-antigen ligase family protein [Candidatus Vogelbacteria bacterium]|nr:O-antigen ligase family protein [Candidatus Vogelbacteria bacterium]
MTMNKVLRNIIVTGIFAIPFIVLYVASSMFFPFITGKNFAFRIIVEIILALWLILILRDESYRPRKSRVLYLVMVFVAVMTLADIFGANFFRSFWSNYERMEGLVTQFHLLAYLFVAGSVLNTEKIWAKYFDVILGVGAFLVAIGTLQLNGVLPINQGGVRLDATLGNSAYLAVHMIFLFFLAVFCHFRSKQEKRQASVWLFVAMSLAFFYWFIAYSIAKFSLSTPVALALGVILLLIISSLIYFINSRKVNNWVRLTPHVYTLLAISYFVILFNTATRGSVIGLILGSVLAACVIIYNGTERQRKNAGVLLIVMITVTVGFMGVRKASFIQDNKVLGRLANSFDNISEQPRFMIWNMALRGFLEHPILGSGQENFNLIFNKYYKPEMYQQEPWFDRAHDVFFDWLTAGGILGLLSYLGIFFAALYVIWIETNSNFKLLVSEKAVFTGLLVAYFVHNIFVFDNLMSYMMFFTILSYLHFGSKKEFEKIKRIVRIDPDFETKRALLSGVVIVGLVLTVYFVNVRAIQQSKNLILAISSQNPYTGKPITLSDSLDYFRKSLSYGTFGNSETREQLVQRASVIRSANVDDSVKNEFLKLADDEMKEQIKSSPTDSRYLVFLGGLYSIYGQGQPSNELNTVAIKYLSDALKYSPKKQTIMFQLVGAFINAKEYDRAYEVAKFAYTEEPKFGEAAKIFAIAAVYNKKEAEAMSVLKEHGFSEEEMGGQLISAYSGAGMYDKVIAILNKGVLANPKNANLHVSLAAAYLAMGQRSRAVDELEVAGLLDPALKGQTDFYISEIKAGRNP